MPRWVEVKCTWCEKIVRKLKKEYDRQTRERGEDINWFCTRLCSLNFRNAIRPDRIIEVEKTCPYCAAVFKTKTGAHSPTYCSKACASADNVTEYRRQRAREVGKANLKYDLETIAQGLRAREAWRYADLKEYLQAHNMAFEFEYPLGECIFDLALPAISIVVEFDGPDHKRPYQRREDVQRDKEAADAGWTVLRVEVEKNAVIHPRVLYGMF